MKIGWLVLALVVSGCEAEMGEPSLSYPEDPLGATIETRARVVATSRPSRAVLPQVEASVDELDVPESEGPLWLATGSKPAGGTQPRADVPECEAGAEAEPPGREGTVLPEEPVAESLSCELITQVHEGPLSVETLADLAQLQQVAVVTGDLYLFLPNTVTSLDLPCLQSVGGRLFKPPCSGSINAQLTTISLPRLTDVGGEVILWFGETLTTVSLPALVSVGGDLSLEGSPQLTHLDLSSLATVGGQFHLSQSPLAELSLPALHSAGALRITGNTSLDSVGLEALTTVTGTLEFTGEEGADGPPLGKLDLNNLETVGGSLLVGRQPNLGNLKLSALEEVGGDLALFELEALTGFVFGSLTVVGGDLDLDANPILGHFCMANLESVGGDLRLTGGEWGGNQHFALSAVATIGGDLVVTDNYALESLPLHGLTTVDGDVVVAGNLALPQCMVDHFVTGLDGEIGGEVASTDNEITCKCTLSGGVIPGTCAP